MRPRIGITAYLTQARWSYWDVPATLVPQGYVDGVRQAGGLPVVLPPTPEGAEEPGALLDALDGLLLIGGADLDPGLYGAAERHPETNGTQEVRDRFEAALARAAIERELPTLGICRGMQLLNCVYGGDLDQHLGDTHDLSLHRPGPGAFGRHPVAVAPGTTLDALVGAAPVVHSTHHQGVARVGTGLVAAAHAPDGTVEAVEDPTLPFCLGVLWHPEEEQQGDGGGPLFRGLVEAARRRAEAVA